MKLIIPTKADYFSSNALTKKQMFDKIIERVNFAARLLGSDIFTENFTIVNLLFFWTFGNILAHIILTIHNVYHYGDDLARFCFLMITVLSAIQGVSMIHVFVFHREDILDLTRRIGVLLEKYNTEKINQMFEKWIIRSCHCGMLLTGLIVGSCILVFLYPIGFYLIFGNKILHFGFELPWIDWQSPLGYTLNFAYAGLIIYLFLFALICTTYVTILFIVTSFSHFELIKILFEELNQLIAGNKKGDNNEKIKKIIAEITENHNDLLA